MKARPISEYHEDMGPVLWWRFPIEEPPYVGTPKDLGFEVLLETTATLATVHGVEIETGTRQSRAHVGGWPGYHTHFTPIETPTE
jgi:hypothetical protein